MTVEGHAWYPGDDEIESLAKDDRFKSLIADFVNKNIIAAACEDGCPMLSVSACDDGVFVDWIGQQIGEDKFLQGREPLHGLVIESVLARKSKDGLDAEGRRAALAIADELESIAQALRSAAS